ncbi:hypothetical protein B0H17DRAFT_1208905 [Mycena rosella]|uniref:Uncharacterized protein n=1 Tax=Mycena rosella TaxID=1033263 RepID=A0AAD7G6P3_MYCRO|nr:hypothetical protein B0H17DRAFT_1208905 [Mycena rosella]
MFSHTPVLWLTTLLLQRDGRVPVSFTAHRRAFSPPTPLCAASSLSSLSSGPPSSHAHPVLGKLANGRHGSLKAKTRNVKTCNVKTDDIVKSRGHQGKKPGASRPSPYPSTAAQVKASEMRD